MSDLCYFKLNARELIRNRMLSGLYDKEGTYVRFIYRGFFFTSTPEHLRMGKELS